MRCEETTGPVPATVSSGKAGAVPAIDPAGLESRSMGNRRLTLALLQELRWSGCAHVAAIERFAAEADLPATGEAAHSLKGAAAIVCAEPLRLLAAEIEAVAASGALTAVTALVAQLRPIMDSCNGEITRLQGSPDAS